MDEEVGRRRLAYHEAGHAVIGRVLGLKCGFVTIEAGHDSDGHSVIADPLTTLGVWERNGKHRGLDSVFRGRIIAYMAGREADEDYFGLSDTWGDEDDRRQINRMLDSGEFDLPTIADLVDYERRLRTWTRVLVRRHRPTIERLADELLLRGKLTGREADRFVARLYRARRRGVSGRLPV